MNNIESAWQELERHKQEISKISLMEHFTHDPERFNSFSLRLLDLFIDFSKNLINSETMRLLLYLAKSTNLTAKRDAMFSGDKINKTEDRAVLHTALRAPRESVITLNGVNIVSEIHAALDKIFQFANEVRSGDCRGTGGRFRNIVQIGIGGSVLGPAAITEALSPYHDDELTMHFVSNVDGAHLYDTLRYLDPATTLFLIASKSFDTQETMLNAKSARDWITSQLGEHAVPQHFTAISSNPNLVHEFGIPEERSFPIWNWVGGRYSLWSAIGLPIAISIGPERFSDLLLGARKMDEHFLNAPLSSNIPVVLGLIGIWYRSVLGFSTHAIIPYQQRLNRFIAHVQQLEMESNGKSIREDGDSVKKRTAGILWGDAGTNAQHSFFQLLHQGTEIVPCDFLLAATSHQHMPQHQDRLIANCLSQSQALMTGRTREEAIAFMRDRGSDTKQAAKLASHRTFTGNRPSTTILFKTLDPQTLGMLIALYEHKVFVQGVIWEINSFDQWGVELGKQMARDLLPTIQKNTSFSEGDSSTEGLLAILKEMQNI